MNLSTQPYRGARDFYPEDKRIQKYMFNVLREVVESFGYQEYDAPILEPVDIYRAKSGEEIINDQLYSFEDRGGRRVAMRPEMTPSVSRMVAGRRQELAYPLRLYSLPNLWRYERPQAGRLREHWQLNVDIFGEAGIAADHEIILVADTLLKAFDASPKEYVIRISSRQLVEYYLHDYLKLAGRQSLDVQKLIDRKHKMPRAEFIAEAKELLASQAKTDDLLEFIHTQDIDSLPAHLKNHQAADKLRTLMKLLKESGVETAVFDPSVVRGMEYYTDIVFEVFDTDPANTRSMFGGGRYDGLVGLFGVEPVPTVGFGMGDVTLQNFLQAHGLVPALKPETDVIVLLVGDVYEKAQPLIQQLRKQGVNIAVDATDRKLDAKLRHAEKSGIDGVFFIGDEEIKNNVVKAKHFKSGAEKTFKLEEIEAAVDRWLNSED